MKKARVVHPEVQLLFDAAPELRHIVDADCWDLPYCFYGNVALYMQESSIPSTTVNAVLKVIQKLSDRDDPATDDLLLAGFFEVLGDDPSATEHARKHLRGRAVELLRLSRT